MKIVVVFIPGGTLGSDVYSITKTMNTNSNLYAHTQRLKQANLYKFICLVLSCCYLICSNKNPNRWMILKYWSKKKIKFPCNVWSCRYVFILVNKILPIKNKFKQIKHTFCFRQWESNCTTELLIAFVISIYRNFVYIERACVCAFVCFGLATWFVAGL